MKAAYIEEPGPPDSIKFGDLPDPHLSGSQVLVQVAAVAVNPVDTYVRGGMIQMDLPRPFVVGCDLAGVIKAVGPRASRFQVGDRVWGSNQGLLGRQGTFSEFVAVDECWLYPTPDGVDDADAAAMALVGITAHLGLAREAKLQRGESVFVNGGSGGVGSAVIQMARAMGARVIATAGSDERVDACLTLGAETAINYKIQDVAAEVKKVAPAGVNVFWETTREPNFEAAVDMLGAQGRMVLMAGRDARPGFPVGPFYVKECSLHGFVMFKATPDEQRVCARDINRWLASGELAARIDREMPLSDTAGAHRIQEENTIHGAGTLAGKIVLRP